ncbi:membrane protein [Microbacterium phage Morrigan]|nr:membrane protein [Microbacterium phage Morrigan]
MDITLEVCKDTYVTTCTPVNPPSFLPDCEDGWEIGNGTAVCATQQPATESLPETGGEPVVAVAVIGVAVVLLGLWTLLLDHRRRTRAARVARDKARWAAALEEEANGFK